MEIDNLIFKARRFIFKPRSYHKNYYDKKLKAKFYFRVIKDCLDIFSNLHFLFNFNLSYSEYKEFFKPDCCFCSESCVCNCSDYNIYPEINAFNALLFTIISLSIILSILYPFTPQNHFDGIRFFLLKKKYIVMILYLYSILYFQ